MPAALWYSLPHHSLMKLGPLLCFFFETGAPYLAQASLELTMILPPQPSEYWS